MAAEHSLMSETIPRRSGTGPETIPRYASYPTPASFHCGVGAERRDAWIASLPAGARVAIYLHIPFCKRICWFCHSRTQAVRRTDVVERYLDALVGEMARVARVLPSGVTIERVAWGGGSPTSLSPGQIRRLARESAALLPLGAVREFLAEVDPATAVHAAYEALAEVGLTAAAIGVQDLGPEVQAAIGRWQPASAVENAVAVLRAVGVEAIRVEQVYGLPKQTEASVARTAAFVASLGPERVAVTDYIHVPRIARRQQMIRVELLPGRPARQAQFAAAARVLVEAGYVQVGIDHFARPGSRLDLAARTDGVRRGFLGYEPRGEAALIGFGAGAISRLPQGFVANAGGTEDYCRQVAREGAAVVRGVALGLEDRVRARAIDLLLAGCDLDLGAIGTEFGDFATVLRSGCADAAAEYPGRVRFENGCLGLAPGDPELPRLVARFLDGRKAATGVGHKRG